jgi:hypothetical protein
MEHMVSSVFLFSTSTFCAFFGTQANPADTCLEKGLRGHGCQSYHSSRPLVRNLNVYIWKKHAVGVACRETMRKLLRNSRGSLSLRQAALINDESPTCGSFHYMAGKCCLALRPVVFLYPTSSCHCPPDIRKRRTLLLHGFCSSSTGPWAHVIE